MADTYRDKARAKLERVYRAWRYGNGPAPPFQPVRLWPVPAWYTRILRRSHRAKSAHAMRHERWDTLPAEKKSASWYW